MSAKATGRGRSGNPADRIFRARLHDQARFPDLTERLALKLGAVPHYTARAHFEAWHRRVGRPNFAEMGGVFTPLFAMDLRATDVPLEPGARLEIRGQTHLAKVVGDGGEITHLVREGHHRVLYRSGGAAAVVVGEAELLNVFTRYDPDPRRRRVTTLPPQLGLGEAPSRIAELPRFEALVPLEREPDIEETEPHVWRYSQTDPNRHVTGLEYLRTMDSFVADGLWKKGHDLARQYSSRARIIFRKPCFRGEGYRRVAWIRSEAPLTVAGVFHKTGDPPGARPAVVVELTLEDHDAAA